GKNTRSTTTTSGWISSIRLRSSRCNSASRSGRAAVGGVVSTPTATGRAPPPTCASSAPYPQRDRPGSMPNTNTRTTLSGGAPQFVDGERDPKREPGDDEHGERAQDQRDRSCARHAD